CISARSAVTSDGGVQALVTTSEAPATDSAVESALGIEAQVDELFSKWDRPDTPGAALGVVRGGELVLERYYGCADLEHGVPLGPESVFDIASTSKQFTAASILLLAQRGQLSLDDEVQAYVPEL